MDRREMLKGTVGGLMLAAAGNSVFAVLLSLLPLSKSKIKDEIQVCLPEFHLLSNGS